jgi:hypothetical protein
VRKSAGVAPKKAEKVRRPTYSPFNFTIDIDVGEVDLWNPVERPKTYQEKMLAENEKRVAEERARQAEERLRRWEAERKKQEFYRFRYTPPPKRDRRRDDGWFDIYGNEYND